MRRRCTLYRDRVPTLDELTGWLRDKLAGFKLPKHLVHVEELPRNASGKVVKGALRSEHGSTGV